MHIDDLPFNRTLGLTVDGNSIVLQPAPEHQNHVGTVHATVIYGIAEAAAGQCLLSRFPELTDSFVAVLRSSKAKYRRPAAADADLRAVGVIDDNAADAFVTALQSRGRATIDVTSTVCQHNIEIFTGTFSWFVGQK